VAVGVEVEMRGGGGVEVAGRGVAVAQAVNAAASQR